MPAQAHTGTASAAAAAQVIDFAARASNRRRPAPAATESARPASRLEEMLAELGINPENQRAMSAQVWERKLQEQKTSLQDPVARAAVESVAAMLEAFIPGMIALRRGDPSQGLDPDPTRGLDDAGIGEIRGIIHDMRDAVAVFAEADVLRGTS